MLIQSPKDYPQRKESQGLTQRRYMATVKYILNRNKSAGSPSVYCRVQQHQVITFDDICRLASANIGTSAAVIRAHVQAVLDAAYMEVLRGNRVDIGNRFLSVYPQVRHTVYADVDRETGEIRWPEPGDVVPSGKHGRVECEVHKRLNKDFRSKVHWERTDVKYRLRR